MDRKKERERKWFVASFMSGLNGLRSIEMTKDEGERVEEGEEEVLF